MQPKIIARILIFLLVIISLEILLVLHIRPVHFNVTIEAGTPVISPTLFAKDNYIATIMTDVSNINFNEIGTHKLEIQVNSKIYTSYLKIKDTIAPVATPTEIVVPYGTEVDPINLVKDIEDITKVSVAFKKKWNLFDIDLHEGSQTVTIMLTDEGNNKTYIKSQLNIYKVIPNITIEAGSNPLQLEDIVLNYENYSIALTDLSTLNLNTVASYNVITVVDDVEYTTIVDVIDTIKPVATITPQISWNSHPIEAFEFVSDIIDNTSVTIDYFIPPSYNEETQNVTLILTDEGGNSSTYLTTLTQKEDNIPPQIICALHETIYLGDPISYRNFVTLLDDSNDTIYLDIDSSEVNLKEVGDYTIIYTATDRGGNVSTKSLDISLIEKPDGIENAITLEEVNELVDVILSDILTPLMTMDEKTFAIYEWTKSNIYYINDSDKSSWIQGAYVGLTTRRGDCYNYYAVATALLTRAGIYNMPIENINKGHFWNLVNLGDGWYHFDATPRFISSEFFMVTDEELKAYSIQNGNSHLWDDTARDGAASL